jgi:hypothetical protein
MVAPERLFYCPNCLSPQVQIVARDGTDTKCCCEVCTTEFTVGMVGDCQHLKEVSTPKRWNKVSGVRE